MGPMSRYADPGVCPDCRQDIPPGTVSCPHCGIPLRGPVAQQLFTTLLEADRLVETLRTTPAPAAKASPATTTAATTTAVRPATRPAPAPVAAPAMSPGLPTYAQSRAHVQAPAAPRGTFPPGPPPLAPTSRAAAGHRFGLDSVPAILVALGAICLLVAGLVFLVVAWRVLGVGGRTLTLLGFTAVIGAVGGMLIKHGLRFAAEAVIGLTLGLLVLDLVGVEAAGWLGDVPDGGLAVAIGSLLLVAGVVIGRTALGSPVKRLVVPEVLAGIGLLVGGIGLVDVMVDATGEAEPSLAVNVVVALLVAEGTRRLRLVFAAALAAIAAAIWWLALAGAGLARGLVDPEIAVLWGELRIWPLLLCTVLAASLALVRWLPVAARVAGAAVAAVLLPVALALPLSDEEPQWLLLVAVLVTLVTVALAKPLRLPWALVPVAPAAPAVIAVTVGLLTFVLEAVTRLLAEPWSQSVGVVLDHPDPVMSPLLIVPSVLAVLAGAYVLLPLLLGERPWSTRTLSGIGLAGVAAGAALTVIEYDVPRWSVVAVLALATGMVVVLGITLGRRRTAPLVVATAFGTVALFAALASDVLTLGALVALTVLAAVVDVTTTGTQRAAAAATWVATLGGAIWTLGHVVAGQDVDLRPEHTAVTVIAVMGVVLLVRLLPASQAAAGVVALLSMAGVLHDATWTAGALTVAGVFTSASALRSPARRWLGWVGAGLLVLATWTRLVDLGVDTVEWYTLPLALGLLGYGLFRMHGRGGRRIGPTLVALTPGLGLALIPSLLVALFEPVSLRALLLGLACAVLVLAGVALRWAAPLVLGAGTGLLLVLREAGAAEVLQQWYTIGVIGALLLVVGVTWEQRLRELRAAAAYVRGLR